MKLEFFNLHYIKQFKTFVFDLIDLFITSDDEVVIN